jgi:hypothetical protein
MMAEAMEREINLTIASRLAFTVFVYGAVIGSSGEHELTDEEVPGAAYATLRAAGIGDDDAKTLTMFCLSIQDDQDPWMPSFEGGMIGYHEWNGGSEVRAVELLSEVLNSAPAVNATTAPPGSLAKEAARVLKT